MLPPGFGYSWFKPTRLRTQPNYKTPDDLWTELQIRNAVLKACVRYLLKTHDASDLKFL